MGNLEQSASWNELDDSIDALEAFHPEAGPEPTRAVVNQRSRPAVVSEPARPAAVERGRPPVSLAALTAAGIRPDWEEAFAIGRGLCQSFQAKSLQGSGSGSTSSPVSSDIVLIEPIGRVRLGSNEPGSVVEAVQSAAKVLSDILPPDSHWLFRTKVLSKALASPDQFATVDDFDQELSVYQTDDGAKLVRALYERWEHGDHAQPVVEALGPLADLPASAKRPQAAAGTRSRYGTGVMLLTLTAVAILGISGWMFVGQQGPHAFENPPEPELMVEGTTSAQEDLAALIPKALATAALNVPASTPVRRAKLKPPVGNAATGPSVPPLTARGIDIKAPSVPPSRSEAEVVWNRASASAAAATPPAARMPVAAPKADAPSPSRAVIYSAANVEVAAPVPVQPRLVAGLRVDSPNIRWDILTIEVVVNADGRVGTVKGLNAPASMAETLVLTQALAAVKSWKFQPATRDGLPVLYRQTVPLRDLARTEP